MVLALLGGLVVASFFALFLSGTIAQDQERAERQAERERLELERMTRANLGVDDDEAGA